MSPGGRTKALQNLVPVYTLGLDTIAGSRLLQLRFGSAAPFQPDRAVMHGDRRARFVRMSEGAAVIQHWGESELVAVPPETLSLPPATQHQSVQRAQAGPAVPRVGAIAARRRLLVEAKAGRLSRRHPRRPPLLHS